MFRDDEDDVVADEPRGRKLYLQQNVRDAAVERIAWAFDTFATVSVSVSGGKDSSVLFEMAYREAERRRRPLNVFFLDQEAEYASSIEVVKDMMHREYVVPYWYQVPCLMTNATSYEEAMLYAFDPAAEADWVHPHVDLSIKQPIPGVNRFYRIMEWVDAQWGTDACSLVGLRSEESLNRYGAVTRHPALPGVPWSSPTRGAVKLYPLYDWTFEDIWTFLGKEGVRYNRVYDWMWAKGFRLQEMRVSNLIHEKAFKSLATLQEFEPATYDRLVKRLKGVHTAALYAREPTVYAARKRPAAFKTWKAYRDFLLDTFPSETKAIFLERFAGQAERESVHRQQVRQLLINDWENNVPVVQMPERENPLKKWMELL